MKAVNSGVQPQNIANQGHQQYHSDEIDLAVVLNRLWSSRWIIMVVTSLIFILGGLVMAILLYWQSANRPYGYLIQLENIVDLRYPNGSEFRLSHLTLPAIFEQTKQDLNFENLPYEDFITAINLTFVNPDISVLQEKYQQLIDQTRNQDTEAIKRIQEAMNEFRGAKSYVQLLLTDSLGLNAIEQQMLLITLVRNWSRYFVAQGVASNLSLLPFIDFSVDQFQNNHLSFIQFQNYLAQSEKNLVALIESNAKTLFFRNQGYLTDLQNRLNLLQQRNQLFQNIEKANLDLSDSKATQRFILQINAKQQTLSGVQETLADVLSILLADAQAQKTIIPSLVPNFTNADSLPPHSLTEGAAEEDGLSMIYSQIIERKLELEEEIATLSNDQQNYNNPLVSYLGTKSTGGLDEATFALYQQFGAEAITLVNTIRKTTNQYLNHYSNPDAQMLYTQQGQPQLLALASINRQLLVILVICILVSLSAMLILVLRNSK